MRVSVIGLGYVGLVTAACLAHDGHRVIGVDIVESKVDLINHGRSPIIEDEIGELVYEGIQTGRLSATLNTQKAIEDSDLAFICVGTPAQADNGSLDTRHVESVSTEIGQLLRRRKRSFIFVLRSTVIPGTVREKVIPALEFHSGRQLGEGYDVLYHPEFLREGSSVEDYYEPSKIVVGGEQQGAADQLLRLYDNSHSKRFITSIETAEAVKYADNAFHALKITFANEIGQFCQVFGVDSREMMELFYADTKLNISTKYLRPGFAFGGSCLPKDLRALLHAANKENLTLPMLKAILPSNESQIERVLNMILQNGGHKVGLVGLAFKPGTDDLRESPLVELAERLVGKGKELCIYDSRVEISQLIGINKTYMEIHLPHLAQLMVDSIDAFDMCDTIIIGHSIADEYLYRWLDTEKWVIDLVGSAGRINNQHYQGVAW